MSTIARFPELGCYTLPGHISDPTLAIDEIKDAERLGFGSIWISERFSAKNADVLSGLAAALTPSMGIAAGLIQNMPLRHPIVTAGYAATMAKLTNNRFALGVGRGTNGFADTTGTPRLTFRIMEDYIGILRRLWRGEAVNYEGPLGRITGLRLGVDLPVTPPVIMAAMGEKTLRWAGRFCDAVVLNSLWTPHAVARSAKLVREGAEEAGRDPASVRIWSILVTACDVPEEAMLQYVVRRMNTYLLFPAMFDGICDANGWDRADAARLRQALSDLEQAPRAGTMGDEATTRNLDDLRKMAALYPRAWITKAMRSAAARTGHGPRSRGSVPGRTASYFTAVRRDSLPVCSRTGRGLRPESSRHRPVNPGL